ncbi:MAG TPA: hypothetical protein VMF09_07145 [Solirubrobacteraceae bacterium]|nr:hypothetical protein [Solirubrobacteraceae bacterium]
MADGLAWDDLPTDLEAPEATIKRKNFDGLAMCLIRMQAGGKTDELFAGMPDDRCQCAHWGYIISGTIRVNTADGARDYTAGETYYWAPGHNLEVVTDVEYFEISKVEDYDVLMEHCRRGLAAAAEAAG